MAELPQRRVDARVIGYLPLRGCEIGQDRPRVTLGVDQRLTQFGLAGAARRYALGSHRCALPSLV